MNLITLLLKKTQMINYLVREYAHQTLSTDVDEMISAGH